MRWQFGVLVPRAYSTPLAEPWFMQTEVLVEPRGEPSLEILVRTLQLQARTVEERAGDTFMPVRSMQVNGKEHTSWEEAVPQELSFRYAYSPDEPQTQQPIAIGDYCAAQPLGGAAGSPAGRVIRRRWAQNGMLRIWAQRAGHLVKFRVRIENHSQPGADGESTAIQRAVALRTSFLSTHALLRVQDGDFVSLLDPPPAAVDAAKACENVHAWPVMVAAPGDKSSRTLMLASPIILYDYPDVAAESEGDKFDGTEIDELLNLSVLGLTDAEKRQARDTDELAGAIVDRADLMAPEHFAKLHGALRYLESSGQRHEGGNGGGVSALGELADEVPGGGHVMVAGRKVAKGSRVRLRPKRRADVWDTFLEGRTALVAGVFEDLEAQHYVAVTVDDDPASDMHEWYGRYLYFYPNEIEPLEPQS